jgi:hypothetical protein
MNHGWMVHGHDTFLQSKASQVKRLFSQWPTGMKTSHAGWMVCEQETLFVSIPIP